MTSPLDTVSSQTALVGGSSVPPAVQAAPAQLVSASDSKKGDFTFHDLLETINPLQHLPLISTAYRAITGDTISPAARIAGDSLYGGIFGLAGSIVDSLVEGETGKDIGQHIVDTVFGDDDDNKQAATAAASPSATPAAASVPVPVATTTAPSSALSAATAAATAEANAPRRPLPPTDFFMSEQKAAHGGRGVPLTTTVSVGDTHKDPKAALQKKIDDALGNAAKASGGPAAAVPAVNSPNPAASDPIMGPTSLMPGAGPTASAIPNGAPAPAPSASVAALMMQALDKYKTLDQQRASNAPAPPSVLIN